jgi:ubiquinone/menaquinone biosynthesis C-methylase UbiE
VLNRMLHKIVAHPLIYDGVQTLAGRDGNYERVAPLVAQAGGGILLDIGAGTGELARIVPSGVTYVWLDNDAQKLSGFRVKSSTDWRLLSEASHIGLRDKSVDIAMCMAMSHHLTDAQLGMALSEVSRVCRRKLIFLDAVREPASRVSNLLWKYDRGSHPRRAGALRAAIDQYFEVDHEEGYSIYHHYWLCTAKPKAGAPWA